MNTSIINNLSSIDWIIFITVLVITFISVIYGQYLKTKLTNIKSQKQSLLDILIMGRRLTLPMFIATLVATWYGGIFGVTEITFKYGIYSFVTQGVFWYVTYLIFAFFLVKKIKSYNSVTMPDLIRKMIGPKSEKLSAVFNLFNVIPIVYIISLGTFLQLLFGQEFWIMATTGIIVVILYSTWGGLRAVVFSDIIQFVVMCSSVIIVVLFSIKTFGGIEFLKIKLPEKHLSLSGGQSLGEIFVWGIIALSTLVDPNFYQRCFAAKSTKTAKNGIIISTIIWCIFDISTTLGAMYARATMPETDSSYAYLLYSINVLPAGLKGFFLAGILATILSTIDSYLFMAGTTLSYDLAPKRFKGNVLFHHMGTVIVGIIGLIFAFVFDKNIKAVWKTFGSYSASCMLLPLVYCYIFPKKITDNQFIFSSIIGVIATSYWINTSHQGFWKNIDELYIGCLATTIGLVGYFIFKNIKKNILD